MRLTREDLSNVKFILQTFETKLFNAIPKKKKKKNPTINRTFNDGKWIKIKNMRVLNR